MPKTRDELDAELERLEKELPALIENTRPEDLIEAFAGHAQPNRDSAGEHIGHVNSRLQCMLRDAGLILGDEEPCSG